MKIGIDCRMLGNKFTGIGIYLENLIKNLNEMDSKNQYILFENKDNPIKLKLNKNFKIKTINCPIYSLKEQILFPIYLYKENCKLIHFPHFNAPLLYLKKNILTIHDLTLHMFPGKKYSKLHHKAAYLLSFIGNCLKSKKIICVSQNTLNDLINKYSFLKRKSEKILLGSNFPEIKEAKQKKNYILYYGNWKSHKNIETLIKGFDILKKDYNFNGKLLLTGKPSNEYPAPIKQIKKSKFKKFIVKLGHVSNTDLVKYIQEAKLVVIPSYYEGFGLQILESLANKTNVISSKTSSLPEVGKDACLYFDPNDPQELSLRANQILTKPKKAEQLIKNYQKFKEDFSYQKMTKKTLKLYASTIK